MRERHLFQQQHAGSKGGAKASIDSHCQCLESRAEAAVKNCFLGTIILPHLAAKF